MPSEREKIEALFGRRMRGESAKHEKELTRLLGSPPDVRNVPPEFWEQVRSDQQERLASILALIFMSSARAVGNVSGRDRAINGSSFSDRAEQFASDRAGFIAERMAQTTQKHLERKSQEWRNLSNRGVTIPANEVHQASHIEFGDSRIQMVVTTETTKATTEGSREGAFTRFGSDTHQVWALGPCQHCTFCPLVTGTDIDCWGSFVDGPPAHPNCCCHIRFVPKGSFVRQCPDRPNVIRAAQQSNIFGFMESRLVEHLPGEHEQKKHGQRGGKESSLTDKINKALGNDPADIEDRAEVEERALAGVDLGAAGKLLIDEGWLDDSDNDESARAAILDAVEDVDLLAELQGTEDAKLDADEVAELYFASQDDAGDGILYGFAIDEDKIKDDLGGYLGAQERQGYNINGQPLRAGEPTLYDGGNYEPEAEPDMDEFVRNQYPTTDWIDGGTGYVLHDGQGVDMSYGSGTRADDHRSAVPSEGAMKRWGWHGDAIENRSVAMNQMMQKARAMRVHVGRGELYVDMLHSPTGSQWRAIQQHVTDYDVTDLRFDVQHGLRGETVGGGASSFGELRDAVDSAFDRLTGGSVMESHTTRVPRFVSVQEHLPGEHEQKKHGRRGGGGGGIRDAVDAAGGSNSHDVFKVVANDLGITEKEAVKLYASEMAEEAVEILLRPGGWDDGRLTEIQDSITDYVNEDFQQSLMKSAVANLPDDLSDIDEESLYSLGSVITNQSTGAPFEEYEADKSIRAEIEKRSAAKEAARVAGQAVDRGKVEVSKSDVRSMRDEFDAKHSYQHGTDGGKDVLGDNLKFQSAFSETAKESGEMGGGSVEVFISKEGKVTADIVDRGKIKLGSSRKIGRSIAGKVPETELAQLNDDIHKWMSERNLGVNFVDLPDVDGPRASEREAVKLSQNIIDSWAASATNGNAVSLATQMSVANVLGTDAVIESASDEGIKAARKLYEGNKNAFDSTVNVIYEGTQKTLKEAGVSEVVLWRGSNFKAAPKGLEWLGTRDAVTAKPVLDMNPLSSFAMDFNTASSFSGGVGDVEMMTVAKVPAAQVFSLSSSGIGCLTESEVLVVGKKLDARLSVVGKNIRLQQMGIEEFWKFADENSGSKNK